MKETTILQVDLSDLKQILKEAQTEAMIEAKSHMFDKYSHVMMSAAEICRLHGTCHKTLNEMVSAGIIFPEEKGKFRASEVLKWDFPELKKKLRYAYKVA